MDTRGGYLMSRRSRAFSDPEVYRPAVVDGITAKDTRLGGGFSLKRHVILALVFFAWALVALWIMQFTICTCRSSSPFECVYSSFPFIAWLPRGTILEPVSSTRPIMTPHLWVQVDAKLDSTVRGHFHPFSRPISYTAEELACASYLGAAYFIERFGSRISTESALAFDMIAELYDQTITPGSPLQVHAASARVRVIWHKQDHSASNDYETVVNLLSELKNHSQMFMENSTCSKLIQDHIKRLQPMPPQTSAETH